MDYPKEGCGSQGAVCSLGMKGGEKWCWVLVLACMSLTLPKDETPDSEKDINRLSTFPFPPCIGSILRRQREERCMPHKR